MKKYLILLILVLLVFNCSYSATKIMPENDWKKKGLKGKVSQMIATTYKYDRNGKLLKKKYIIAMILYLILYLKNMEKMVY